MSHMVLFGPLEDLETILGTLCLHDTPNKILNTMSWVSFFGWEHSYMADTVAERIRWYDTLLGKAN